MPPKRGSKPVSWVVPYKGVVRGNAFVTAVSAEEAIAKFEASDWDSQEGDLTTDIERDGEPEVND